MKTLIPTLGLVSAALLFSPASEAQQSPQTSLEYIGRPVREIPVSQAVKAGEFVFVLARLLMTKASSLSAISLLR